MTNRKLRHFFSLCYRQRIIVLVVWSHVASHPAPQTCDFWGHSVADAAQQALCQDLQHHCRLRLERHCLGRRLLMPFSIVLQFASVHSQTSDKQVLKSLTEGPLSLFLSVWMSNANSVPLLEIVTYFGFFKCAMNFAKLIAICLLIMIPLNLQFMLNIAKVRIVDWYKNW